MGNKIFGLMDKFKSRSSPVIVILGSTGTGKSKLAIQLAKKFNGEIISADSMQVYKGLDIITNKVTPEEQAEAVHHFINCTNSLTKYTVVDFQKKALPLIDNLLLQKKTPIIVGGTNYYIESLVFDVLIKPEVFAGESLLFETDHDPMVASNDYDRHKLDQNASTVVHHHNLDDNFLNHGYSSISNVDEVETLAAVKEFFNHKITYSSVQNVSNDALHSMLQEVDPTMANSLHPNDRRKVLRSLQVFQQHHCCHSDLLAQQRSKLGGSSLGGPLRFHNAVMLWLQCDKNVLHERLDKRVDEMIENGLITELLNFHEAYNVHRLKQNLEENYEEGIFQSIGFKEFHDYLVLTKEERTSPKGEKMCQKAIEEVKLTTRRYARKQVKWIKNRFLKKPDRKVGPIYSLNATDVEQWDSNVLDTASYIIQCAIQGVKPEISPLAVESPNSTRVLKTYFCEICNKRIVGSDIWKIHINSRKHYRQKASLKKKEKRKAEINEALEV